MSASMQLSPTFYVIIALELTINKIDALVNLWNKKEVSCQFCSLRLSLYLSLSLSSILFYLISGMVPESADEMAETSRRRDGDGETATGRRWQWRPRRRAGGQRR